MDTLLAVAYPAARPQFTDGPGVHTVIGPITFIQGHFPRYDLGLLEWMFTVVLAACLAATWHKKLWTGTYAVVVCLSYAPVRFAMDFLRIRDEEGSDPRYGGLTPAQWCCVALFFFGVGLLVHVVRLKKRGVDPADAVKAFALPAPSSAV